MCKYRNLGKKVHLGSSWRFFSISNGDGVTLGKTVGIKGYENNRKSSQWPRLEQFEQENNIVLEYGPKCTLKIHKSLLAQLMESMNMCGSRHASSLHNSRWLTQTWPSSAMQAPLPPWVWAAFSDLVLNCRKGGKTRKLLEETLGKHYTGLVFKVINSCEQRPRLWCNGKSTCVVCYASPKPIALVSSWKKKSEGPKQCSTL